MVAHHILIGCDGLVGLVQTAIALGQLQGALPTQGAILVGCLGISLAILFGSIVILAHSPELIAFFDGLFGSAAVQQQRTHYYIYIRNELSHTISINEKAGVLLPAFYHLSPSGALNVQPSFQREQP